MAPSVEHSTTHLLNSFISLLATGLDYIRGDGTDDINLQLECLKGLIDKEHYTSFPSTCAEELKTIVGDNKDKKAILDLLFWPIMENEATLKQETAERVMDFVMSFLRTGAKNINALLTDENFNCFRRTFKDLYVTQINDPLEQARQVHSLVKSIQKHATITGAGS